MVIYPTAQDAAREAGISRGAVIAAKAIRRHATPEVSAAVEAGTLTLHAAEQIIAAVPKAGRCSLTEFRLRSPAAFGAEQPAVVAKVIEASRGKVLGARRYPDYPGLTVL